MSLSDDIDDVLSLNKPHFIKCLHLIYPSEQNTTKTGGSALCLELFLDLKLTSMTNVMILTFLIVNLPFSAVKYPLYHCMAFTYLVDR